MWIEQIRLKNVRNLSSTCFALGPGVHYFQGPNGSGKTSFLEAVAFLITGRSFRTHRFLDMIAHDSLEMTFEAVVFCRQLRYDLSMRVSSSGKKSWLGKKPCRDWLGLFPCATWIPEDVEVIKGGPNLRRRFLDQHLLHVDPLYQHHFHRYQRSLEQRCALLKQIKEEGLELYEKQMALSGSYLMKVRSLALQALEPCFREKLSDLGFGKNHALLYKPCCQEASVSALEYMWSQSRPQERRAKQTLKGPHLEDFQVLFQDRDARRFASEGEARAAIACLKVAEWQRLAGFESQALLLIDEVGIGLDDERWQRIWSWMGGGEQAILTTPYKRPVKVDFAPFFWDMKEGVAQRSGQQGD